MRGAQATMNDAEQTTEQLAQEVVALRQRVAQLEALGSQGQWLDAMLQEERQFVSAILATVGALIVVLDAPGRIVRFNQACEQTTGYAFEEVRGKYVWDLFLRADDVASVQQGFEALRTAQSRTTWQHYWLTKQGEPRLISWSNTALRASDGTLLCMISTGLDITGRTQAERAVAEGDARIRAIVDTTVDGIITIDERGRIETFNRAAERLFGYSAAEVRGQNVSLLMPEPYHGEHNEYLARYLRTGEKKIIGIGREVVGRRKDGTTFPMELSVSEVAFNQHRLFSGIVRDVSARKQAEQELQRADRLAMVGQLASGLAHEIGTPLNVIEGNAELLRMELREQNLSTASLDTIIEQTDRITRLIQQLLTFARTQKQPVEPVSLHTPLSNTLRLLEARFRHDAISVSVDVPDDLPHILGTSGQIEQVFLNVLVNAWHAMPEGGSITIEMRTVDDHQVQIVFRDTGCGISREDVPLVFEPFFSTKGEQGTGLGLAICKQIIERHHGTIQLHSTVGVGTTVTIALPRLVAHARTTQTEQEA